MIASVSRVRVLRSLIDQDRMLPAIVDAAEEVRDAAGCLQDEWRLATSLGNLLVPLADDLAQYVGGTLDSAYEEAEELAAEHLKGEAARLGVSWGRLVENLAVISLIVDYLLLIKTRDSHGSSS